MGDKQSKIKMNIKVLMNQFIKQPKQNLPISRVRKIMKNCDPDVRCVSNDSAIVMAKACEMLMAEMTIKANYIREQHHRRTILRQDVVQAVMSTESYSFLVDAIANTNGIDSSGNPDFQPYVVNNHMS